MIYLILINGVIFAINIYLYLGFHFSSKKRIFESIHELTLTTYKNELDVLNRLKYLIIEIDEDYARKCMSSALNKINNSIDELEEKIKTL